MNKLMILNFKTTPCLIAKAEVDDNEIEDYEKISEELEHISMTIEALQLWCEKMKLGENK